MWFDIMWYLGMYKKESELLVRFGELRSKWPTMSKNRVAYYVLKKYYSTTAMKCLRFLYGVH